MQIGNSSIQVTEPIDSTSLAQAVCIVSFLILSAIYAYDALPILQDMQRSFIRALKDAIDRVSWQTACKEHLGHLKSLEINWSRVDDFESLTQLQAVSHWWDRYL